MFNYNYFILLKSYSKQQIIKDILYIKRFFYSLVLGKLVHLKTFNTRLYLLRSPFVFKNSFEKYSIQANRVYLQFYLSRICTLFRMFFEMCLSRCINNISSVVGITRNKINVSKV